MNLPAASVDGASRFSQLWQRNLIEGAEDQSAAIHRDIVAAYGEPQRHYHTMAHIEHCLAMFDQCKSLVDDPDAVELSIWFHDVVYQPGACNNEALSAEYYQRFAEHAHARDLRNRVYRMIMATLHIDEPIEDNDTRFMVDIDLSSFGLPWDEFLRDSQNLRLENPKVSDAEHYDKAKKFQCGLLDRDRFYQTDYFHRRLEDQARQNLDDYFEYLLDKL